MIEQLTRWSSLAGVVAALGSGFYAYGIFENRISQLENTEFVVNETVDLAPVNEKIADLEVEILDRMSALEDEWMARDNDSNDDILNDIASLKSDVENFFDKATAADNQLQLNIVELSDKTFKEFGKIRDLINQLETKVAVTDKQTQLNGILIEEIQEQSKNPLSN